MTTLTRLQQLDQMGTMLKAIENDKSLAGLITELKGVSLLLQDNSQVQYMLDQRRKWLEMSIDQRT